MIGREICLSLSIHSPTTEGHCETPRREIPSHSDSIMVALASLVLDSQLYVQGLQFSI